MPTLFAITVRRSDLTYALKQIANAFQRNETAEAVLSCDDEALLINLPGGQVGLPYDGSWPGQVRVPGSVIVRLAKVLPSGDPLEIIVKGDRLHIATLSVACKVEAAGSQYIELPVDPPLWTIIGVQLRHSANEIEHSGLLGKVRAAEERRDILIQRAADVLAPLGIEVTDVVRLVEEIVRRKNH